MQRILEKKTPTRVGFWACGLIYCNLPLATAGLAVVLLHGLPCTFFINVWILTQAFYTLLQPFFVLPFFFKPSKRTKAWFLFISISCYR